MIGGFGKRGITLKERSTTPRTISNWGTFYINSTDGLPYLLDSSGVSHPLSSTGVILEADFDATSFLYATLDDTPEPKTPAEVMAILSGEALAGFSFNNQYVTAVQQLRGCADHHLNIYANNTSADPNEKDIIFWTLREDNNTWVEVFRCKANGVAPTLDLVVNLTTSGLIDGVDVAGRDHNSITLHASATTGGMSLSTQEISNRAATNAQTGYATAAHITAIEANTTHRGVAAEHYQPVDVNVVLAQQVFG